MAEYEGKVHTDGPDTLIVENGGEVIVRVGGTITNEGTSYVVTEPDDVTLEINGSDEIAVKEGGIDTAELADEAVTADKLDTDTLAVLVALLGISTENVAAPEIWLDGTTFKLGTLGD